jgi:ELWxxDGT repeat protein
VNGTLFFRADDGTNREELWTSDGTAAGTALVKDINPAGSSVPARLTVMNGTLFFSAHDGGTYGTELWRSDGTAAGTVLVEDINPAGDSGPSWLTAVNGTLFFAADDGTTGIELWQSDGTAAGTVRTVGGGWTMAAPIATSSSSTPWIPCSTWRPARAINKSSRPWRGTSWPRLN